MTIDETHPCPKCGQRQLAYDGLLAWRHGPRPPRNLARKDLLPSTGPDQERERIYHCAQCGAEYFEDVETHRIHLWEEGTGRQYLHDPRRGGWYLRYFDKANRKWIEQAVPGETGNQPAVGPIKQTTIEVIPDQLSVYLYWHTIAYQTPIPCWTYVTQGLWAYHQKELALTLRQDAGMVQRGQTPDFLLRPIQIIYDLARAGRLVDSGGHTSLTLADAQQKVGIPFNMLYLHPVPLAGIPLPEQALTVRLMHPEELKAYQTFGAMRLMSSWANHWRYFPYPPWSELPTPGIAIPPRYQASILNKVPRFNLTCSTTCLEGNEVVWRLQSQAGAPLAENLPKLPPDQPMAFLPGFDLHSDACLAWVPEQNQIMMNLPPGSQQSRVAGCFLLFVPGQQTVTVKIVEDGFAIMLPTADWIRVREALLNKQPMRVSSPAWSFRLEHLAE